MKRKFWSKFTMIGALATPLATTIACGSEAVTLDPAKQDSIIMIVGPIGHKDKGFNQGGHDGAKEALKEIAKLKHYSEVKTKTSDIPGSQKAVTDALLAGAYIVLGAGYQYPTFMNEADYAGKYPDREFIGLDGNVNTSEDGAVKKNVTTISFKAELAAFLAGIAAGIYLAKNYDIYSGDGGLKAGAFGGGPYPPVQKMIAGYMMGLAYYNDHLAKNQRKVKFVGWGTEKNGFTGTFSPDSTSVAIAKTLLQKKVDVVFPVAGGQVSSMVDEIKAQSANTKIIGVDSDQTKVFGNDGKLFITSAMKSTKTGALEAIKAIYGLTTDIKKGENNVVGLKGGFVSGDVL